MTALEEKKKVHCYSKRYRGSDELAGRDLTGWRFDFADLRGADLRGCTGTRMDFRNAILNEANLEGATFSSPEEHRRCDFTGARMRGANLTDCAIDFHSSLVGVDMQGVTIKKTRLEPNGYWTRGIILPDEIPFHELSHCWNANPLIARLLYDETDNPEVHHIARYALTRDSLSDDYGPCWGGSRKWIETNISDAGIEEFERVIGLYPDWGLLEAWESAGE